MLTLITGRPGTGKTQYAISRFIIDERKENPNRRIYANIKGLKIDKLQAITGGDPVGPAPDDWRELPDGSLVIYDEAQAENLFPATGKPGAPTDERVLRFDTHRHRGFDIVLITQDQSLVHHWARKFVGRFIHLERHDGVESTHVSEWGEVVNPSDFHEKQRADKSTRSMDKRVWDVYDSATIHTHKFKVPSGAKLAIKFFLVVAFLFITIVAGVYYFARYDESPPQESDTPSASEDQPVSQVIPSAFSWRDTPTVQAINGCASSDLRCRCWDFEGKVIDLEESMCRNLAEGVAPMPIDLNRFMGQGGAGEWGERDAPPSPAPVLSSPPIGLGSFDRSIALPYVPPEQVPPALLDGSM